jgi:hypothetical protein
MSSFFFPGKTKDELTGQTITARDQAALLLEPVLGDRGTIMMGYVLRSSWERWPGRGTWVSRATTQRKQSFANTPIKVLSGDDDAGIVISASPQRRLIALADLDRLISFSLPADLVLEFTRALRRCSHEGTTVTQRIDDVDWTFVPDEVDSVRVELTANQRRVEVFEIAKARLDLWSKLLSMAADTVQADNNAHQA